MMKNSIFFGTDEFSILILDELKAAGLMPALIVTVPDTVQGRGNILTPPPIKAWADKHGVPVLQPSTLNLAAIPELTKHAWDIFIVASYGKILPKELLNLPTHGTLNVHPSLLPKFRGASPIESAILADEKETGVTIMLMDEKMDHGPIIAQVRATIEEWPLPASALHTLLGHLGGTLLAETIPEWLQGTLTAEAQNEEDATYTTKIKKGDAQISLSDDPYTNLLKICAYDMWPGAFFFTKRHDREIRVKITDAEITDGELHILKVIPEGKKEMDYQDFLRG